MNAIHVAAHNNAHLVAAVCRAHGCAVEIGEATLLCKGTPPRFYPQAVTLTEGAFGTIRDQVDQAFKDSFCDAEPELARFGVLFTAQWLWKEPATAFEGSVPWARIQTDADLLQWEQAWVAGDPAAPGFPRQFPTSLLDDPDLAFFAARINGKVVAGVLFNVTTEAVGISNTFAAEWDEAKLWAEVANLAHREFPKMPLTGYASDGSLTGALGAGFGALGPLRVWVPTRHA